MGSATAFYAALLQVPGYSTSREGQQHKLFHNILPELGTRSFFPGSLSAHFLSMDRYRSFCRFSGSLIAQWLSKYQWFALGKER